MAMTRIESQERWGTDRRVTGRCSLNRRGDVVMQFIMGASKLLTVQKSLCLDYTGIETKYRRIPYQFLALCGSELTPGGTISTKRSRGLIW